MQQEHGMHESIFWVEVDRIKPNPYQPRKVFDDVALASLAESIRQYGVLQPLTVTRKETEKPGEGIFVEYELIAGERRLRASKMAGLKEVPVVIRTAEDSDRVKLELAIIENLQREDLNPLDRAFAFQRLVDEFGLRHAEVGKRVGKSREYVSNTLRILALPKEMQEAVQSLTITEGHTRPLLMLSDKPQEQATLFKEILNRKLTVRDTEQLARRVATEKIRKSDLTPELISLERELTESLGTRVRIERDATSGGKLLIEFFSAEDLANLRVLLASHVGAHAASAAQPAPGAAVSGVPAPAEPVAQPAPAPEPEPEDDLYSISTFSV